ncbi:MAG: dipeptide epimerase, partial [Paracoccaceae bacterium]|nr:dipeptide epimerase [Paracoccaceae bacterium]
MQIKVSRDVFRLAEVFTISRGSRTAAEVLTVTVTDGAISGRGECVPYARYSETLESVEQQILALPDKFDRASLQHLMEPGAARNAIDCALWDLEAKSKASRVWKLAGLPAPKPEITAYTLSL